MCDRKTVVAQWWEDLLMHILKYMLRCTLLFISYSLTVQGLNLGTERKLWSSTLAQTEACVCQDLTLPSSIPQVSCWKHAFKTHPWNNSYPIFFTVLKFSHFTSDLGFQTTFNPIATIILVSPFCSGPFCIYQCKSTGKYLELAQF